MASPRLATQPRWTSLWIVALLSLVAQLWLCQFFSHGQRVPLSLDTDPCNLWKYAYQAPPRGEYLVLNWLGIANLPPPMNPFSLASHLPPWLFFTTYAPVVSTLALLAIAAFLRELELPRPAALFGAVIYAWQGDILTFIFPGHYGYMGSWPFYALAAWGALRAQRIGHWAYALISGASCGIMVGLEPDRGAIASLLVAALYLGGAWRQRPAWLRQIGHLALCAVVALAVSFAAFLALFQSFIVGVSMGGATDATETYNFDTQFSIGPEETLSYLVPGFFGWHSSDLSGPYWGRVGERADWNAKHIGPRNFDLALTTTGTIPAILGLVGALVLLARTPPGPPAPGAMSARQRFFGRVLLGVGALGLLLAWGYHLPSYRLLYLLPLMDKWRNPLKWLELTNFAAVALSAIGLQYLLSLLNAEGEPLRQLRCRHARLFLDGMLALLVLGLIGSYVFLPSLAPYFEAVVSDPSAIPPIVATLHVSLGVAAMMSMLLCLLVRVAWHPERPRTWTLENPLLNRAWKAILQPAILPASLALTLALLSAIQLGWVATHFIVPIDYGSLTATNPLVEQLKSEGNTVRTSVLAPDPSLNRLLQNQFNTPKISCLEISAASRLPDALTAFLHNFEDDPARLWFLAGVKNRVVPQVAFNQTQSDERIKANIDHVDGYVLEPTGAPNLPSHALIHLRDFLAKATFVPGAEILSAPEQLKRMRDPGWNPRAIVLLAEASPLPAASGGRSPSSVALTAYGAHLISLEVHAAAPGYVLIDDAYDPDWQVEINGQAAPLLRADFMLRAVPVPEGASSVSLHYVGHYHLAGLNLPVEPTNLLCDGTMLLVWIVAGIALWRRQPSANTTLSPPSIDLD